jgi:hypothetical protein
VTAYYKVTAENGASFYGGTGKWVEGRWRSVKGDLIACQRGLHLCRERDLVSWLGPVIWEAEVHPDAAIIEAADKVVVSKARVVRRLDTWNERTARLFAADCAERVVHLCGDDPRPQAAIDVARRYANGEATATELAAVWAAAWAAARDAARDAAWDAARAAARAATELAAARAAVWDAAWDAEAQWQSRRLMQYLRGEQ